MSTVVYQFGHSPFCIPITAALTGCSVPYETREVSNADRSEVLTLTAGQSYQVPVLVHDGKIVFETGGDTQDVAQYVNTHFAGGKLFPAKWSAPHECMIDFLENEVELRTFKLVDPTYLSQIPDPAVRGMIIRHKERKFGRGCIEQWTRNAGEIRAEADRLLARFESTLQQSPFLMGEEPIYADYLLYGILDSMMWKNWNSLSPEQAAISAFMQRLRVWRY